MKTIDMTNLQTGGGGCLRQSITQERFSKNHFARLFNKRTTFFKSFFIGNAFRIKDRVNGFTLAEVLITLGIIGIVAALTLPGLVAKHRKEVLKAEFKKTYSELQQINLMFIKDEGLNMCEYNWMLVDGGSAVMEASKEFSKKFIEYFAGKNEYIDNEGINKVKTLTGSTAAVTMFDDGSVWNMQKRTFYFEYGNPAGTGKCPVITVDINGYYKKPNQLGVDMFSFRPTKDGRVIPLGNPDTKKDAANGSNGFTECSMTSSDSTNGMGCAYWASIDKNPMDNTKDYWNDFIK